MPFTTPDRSGLMCVSGGLHALRGRHLRSYGRARWLTVLLLPVAVLTACAPPAASDALPAGVTVAVTQLRSDVADRQVEVQVHNGGGSALQIGAVSLADPRFVAPAERVIDRTSTLAPGGTVNVRVQLAVVDCDAPADARSTVTLSVDGGRAVAPAPEVFPFLDALHTGECVAQRAGERATIELTEFDPSPAGEPARLVLSVTPRSDAASVRIVGIRETNLLTFDGLEGGMLPLSTAPVDLPLRPARCDPHAVQEDKRGTVFTLEVEIDGVPGQFTLAADPDMRGRMLTWVADWCGFG